MSLSPHIDNKKEDILILGKGSPHIDNKKEDILILGKGPIHGLEHTLTAEKLD